jgi:uncharacterized protein YjbI with pentapeptide repeats
MAFRMWRAWTAGTILAVALTAGSLAGAAAPVAAAADCPAVDPTTHLTTPAPSPGVDWSGCVLDGANLSNADLSGANLMNASLTSADLDWANLTNANLGDADLTDAALNYAVVTGSDIGGAKLGGTSMTDITSGGLIGGYPGLMPSGWTEVDGYLAGPAANLDNANLTDANLPNLDLSGAGLAGANLTGANLSDDTFNNDGFDNATLKDANLTGATLAGVTIGGADLTDATLFGASSGGITGEPAELPANWHLVAGYLVGPSADLQGAALSYDSLIGADLRAANLDGAVLIKTSLESADLTGANLSDIDADQTDFGGADLTDADLERASLYYADLTDADLTDADLTGASLVSTTVAGANWTGATCPDGTTPVQHAPVGCTTPLDKTPPAAEPSVTAGAVGAHGWYTTPVTVAWHWTDAGEINLAACTQTSTSAGNGLLTLTATCADMAGNVGQASYTANVDTTRPTVSVTGVASGARHVYGKVPAAGCATTDAVSGVSVRATVKVTTTGKNGVGSFTATCAGAISVAGSTQAAPVRVGYTVVYGFGGFSAPKAGGTLKKSAPTFTVKFRLVSASAAPIADSVAAALAKAHDVRVTLRGPGIAAVTADCTWSASAKDLQCAVRTPKGIKAGKSNRYTITAYENTGPGFTAAPAIGVAANPETVYFG